MEEGTERRKGEKEETKERETEREQACEVGGGRRGRREG